MNPVQTKMTTLFQDRNNTYFWPLDVTKTKVCTLKAAKKLQYNEGK